MSDRSLARYDVEALRRAIPHDRAEMFLGFVPWPDDSEGWPRFTKERFAEAPDRSVVRTVWNHPEDRDQRVLIEVVECSSSTEALEALVGRLAWNQLPRLEEGPKGLGYVAFMHPAGVPPGLLFLRGNLCVSVVSFGKAAVVVLDWAGRLNHRLDDRPATDRATISLRLRESPLKADQESILEYGAPWRYGEEAYCKFFVTGGSLVRKDKNLVLSSGKPGALQIEAYILEPGREPHTGRLSVNVE